MAKRISGYFKLSHTEGKAVLDYFSQENVLAPPKELYQMLSMLEEYYNPKKVSDDNSLEVSEE